MVVELMYSPGLIKKIVDPFAMLPFRAVLLRASRTYVAISRQVINKAQMCTFSSSSNASKIPSMTSIISTPSIRTYSTASAEAPEEEAAIEPELSGHASIVPVEKRPIDAIMADYKSLKTEGSSSSINSHTLIGELAGILKFEECLGLLNDMKAAGTADAKSYSYTLLSARPSLHLNEVRFLFGEPSEGRFADETSSPENIAPSDNFSTICKLLEEMKNNNMELESFFYDDLARSLSSGRQAGLMINICNALEKRGITPSIHFYNMLLNTLPKRGFMQRATSLYERMVARGIATYNTHIIRIDQLLVNGRLDDGLALYKQVHEKTAANLVAHNILVNGYLKNGRLPDALKLYRDMKKSGNQELQPDRYTITSLLSHYYTTSDLEGASEVLADMKTFGFPRLYNEYGLLIRLNARYDPSQALKVLQDAITNQVPLERLAPDLTRLIIDKRVLNEWKVALHDAYFKGLNVNVSDLKMDGPLCQLVLERPNASATTFRHMFKEMAALIETNGWFVSTIMLEYILRRFLIQNNFEQVKNLEAYLKDHKVTMSWNIKNLLMQCHLMSGDRKAATDMLNALIRSKSPLTSNSQKMLQENDIAIPPGIRTLGRDRESPEGFKILNRYNANHE